MTSKGSQIDLNPHDLDEVVRLLKLYVPELEVWAFGSRVSWKAKSHSDLDLALMTNEPLSLERLAELIEAFDESPLPIRVDLVDWAKTSESFRQIIQQQKVVIKDASPDGERLAEWPVMSLESALDALIDYRGKTPEKMASGIPLVTAKVIKNGRIERPTEFIDPETYDVWMRRGIPKAGDIVLTTEAPLGEVAQLGPEKVALAQRVITLRGKAGVLDNSYLLYLLQTEEMQEQLRSRATGTTVLGIKQSELRKISIRVPPIAMQRSAATTLRALDDRITLLRETNATLEAIAQTLFKSWFVDFDPVRAKQEGRVPEGMDEATAALFPWIFEESVLGPIPKGWDTCAVYDIATYLNGAAYKAFGSNLERRGLPIIKIAELKSGVTAQTAYSDVVMPEKYRILTGDILLSWSGNPDTSIDTFVWPHGHAWLNQHIFRVLPHVNAEHTFVLRTLKHLRPVFAELARNKQTTGLGHVTVADLKRLRVVKPGNAILECFDSIVAPIHKKMLKDDQLVSSLAAIRNSLLPRLISGQMRLPDTDDALIAETAL